MSPIKFLLLLALAITGNAFTTSTLSHHRSTRVSQSMSPTDFADVSSIVIAKYDAKALVFNKMHFNSDVAAQVLSDSSHAVMDFPNVFAKKKLSKLQMQYAQVIGRLMTLMITLVPHHGVSPEELGVQLFLLGVSMKPVIRSIKLFKCIASAQCHEECELELYELEESLP